MKTGLVIVLVILAIIVVGAFMVGGSYIGARNQMVAMKQAADQSFSEVDIQMQRRADLIPNLVQTVKGYATQEQVVFGDIANARAGLLNAQGPAAKIAANNTLDGAIGRLLAISENYPQLRSNENFLRLQDELAGTENRISVARRRYNETVNTFNTYIQQFPNNIWAKFAGFNTPLPYFQASPESRAVPKVDFGGAAAPAPAPAMAPAPAPAK
jgi:LemA protein